MKLFEHQEFQQAVLQAAEHFKARGLRAAVIEKDYYVTEALRALADAAGDRIIFKGGTSLSKGWNLIQRFSEDIDLFLDPQAFTPTLGKRGIDRELKVLRDAIAGHPAFTFEQADSKTFGGFGRNDIFSYAQHFGGAGEVANRVLLEAATASGREPTARIELRSYLSEFLTERGISLGATDETPFEMTLLHFRRTFVEKMFAIHGKVELLKRDNRPIGSYARHYYDLFQLASNPEILTMLKSDEYGTIKADYDRISRTHFDRGYFPPPDMSFSKSDALFPSAKLEPHLEGAYQTQCQLLCYGAYPSWKDLQEMFLTLRPHL